MFASGEHMWRAAFPNRRNSLSDIPASLALNCSKSSGAFPVRSDISESTHLENFAQTEKSRFQKCEFSCNGFLVKTGKTSTAHVVKTSVITFAGISLISHRLVAVAGLTRNLCEGECRI